MKNFLKHNLIKGGASFLFVAIVVIYYWQHLEKVSTLDLQSKCATQTQMNLYNFEKRYTNDTLTNDGLDNSGKLSSSYIDFSYQNHYNKKLDRCFVLISYNFTPLDKDESGKYYPRLEKWERLFDTYENTELASCVHRSDFIIPDACIIEGWHGLAEKEKYREFVNHKMELSQ